MKNAITTLLILVSFAAFSQDYANFRDYESIKAGKSDRFKIVPTGRHELPFLIVYYPKEYYTTDNKFPIMFHMSGNGEEINNEGDTTAWEESRLYGPMKNVYDKPDYNYGFVLVQPMIRYSWPGASADLLAEYEKFVGSDPRIDSRRVALSGLSNGAWTSTMLYIQKTTKYKAQVAFPNSPLNNEEFNTAVDQGVLDNIDVWWFTSEGDLPNLILDQYRRLKARNTGRRYRYTIWGDSTVRHGKLMQIYPTWADKDANPKYPGPAASPIRPNDNIYSWFLQNSMVTIVAASEEPGAIDTLSWDQSFSKSFKITNDHTQPITVQLQSSDDSYQLSAQSVTIDPGKTVTVTAIKPRSEAGLNSFTVTATAQSPKSVDHAVVSYFVETQPNPSPEVLAQIEPLVVELSDTAYLSLNQVFSDPEDVLTYTALPSQIAGFSFIGDSLAIFPQAIGTDSVSLAATDSIGQQASVKFALTVYKMNNAPEAALDVLNDSVAVGSIYYLDLNQAFSDVDGDALAYKTDQGQIQDGVLSFTSEEVQEVDINVSAQDPGGLADSLILKLVVFAIEQEPLPGQDTVSEDPDEPPVVTDLEPERDSVDIMIFPNPTNGSFRILSDVPVVSIRLLDATGKTARLYQQGDYILAGAPGVYVLKIQTIGSTFVRKLILKP